MAKLNAYYDEMVTTMEKECNHPSSRSSRRDRDRVLRWEEYFMFLAYLTAERSKDPVTKVRCSLAS